MSGMFITLEGIEGAGKSSSIGFLRDAIEAAGQHVVTTREPGGPPMAEAIRQALLGDYDVPMPAVTELLLMFAARSAHLEQTIRPALARGDHVVCDRFTDASYAYQGAARGLGDKPVQMLEELTQGGLRPDLVLLFDLPVEQGLQRVAGRGQFNRFDTETLAFHETVRSAYLERARAMPARYVIIDAARDSAGVRDQLKAALATRL